jgi:histone RNA hairpin-binding protein
MMYLIPDPVATKQLSGIADSSPSRPSPSKPYQHAEKSSPSLLSYIKSPSSHRRRHYSSDEEDDSRDRQSHWKRIKTRSDDNPRGSTRNLIRYTERDYERSPPRVRQQAPSSSIPRPGHRVIVLKGSGHERDARLRRISHESEGRTGSGSKGWDGAVGMRVKDGGTASKDIDPGGSQRKHHETMSALGDGSRCSLMMSERSMVVREKLTARRAPVEKGYEFRVSGREVGEFVHGEEDDSLFLEDSRQVDDGYSARARIGSDVRESLNRRSRAEETMSRETRSYGDYRAERFCSDDGVRVRRVESDVSAGNGKVQGFAGRKGLDLGRSSRSGNDDVKERSSLASGGSALASGGSAASVGAKSEREMESERRQEKRERWAEKERDLEKELEKENMPKTTQPTTKVKSVTVVDYSHKFTLAKAPISKRPTISSSTLLESLACSGFVQTQNPHLLSGMACWRCCCVCVHMRV